MGNYVVGYNWISLGITKDTKWNAKNQALSKKLKGYLLDFEIFIIYINWLLL
jgi:hypothetical protein